MANNILTAKVTIKGVRPLLWHHFGPEALPLEKQERTGVAGNDPEEWKKTVLKTKDGQLYIDPSYVFACIREGSKHTKKGKGSIQKMVQATLQVITDRILVDRYLPENITELVNETDEPVYMDVRSVRNPSTGARNVRYRVAVSPGWITTFEIMWDKTIISRGEMEASVIDAGKFSGIGDGRNIGFGRFVVKEFDVKEDVASATA
ncbi:MAG: hypothetical protein A4E52_01331 [Pelotomaculum sp. PtaB.Bin013]|nr:MAG: hypothetical protein A4E52_01331 [Pelotomaculum sp. PtaB.Bin013]